MIPDQRKERADKHDINVDGIAFRHARPTVLVFRRDYVSRVEVRTRRSRILQRRVHPRPPERSEKHHYIAALVWPFTCNVRTVYSDMSE